MAKFKAPKVANNAKAIPPAPMPQRGERTAKNYAKQEARKNGPGGEPRHPQSHDEWMQMGND